ncbi:hypothetical protein ACMDCR_15645 [Labrys okinawensis]|uniref:hypothetical protein n=1 Tax=Labrys okinawensis TaxID=346911 RepID=UPI0039BCA167
MKSLFARKIFWILFVIPNALSVLYFGIIASPQYISESRFVVAQADDRSAGALAALMGSGSYSLGGAYIIHDYLESWEGMLAAARQFPLRQAYGSNAIDPIGRLGGLWYYETSEVSLWNYFRSKVVDGVDDRDNVSTLQVYAYDAASAKALNTLLLAQSQDLLNRLNQEKAAEATQVAAANVKTVRARLQADGARLADFRDQHLLFDPSQQATIQMDMVSRLKEAVLRKQSELSTLEAATPNNPGIPNLRNQIAAMQSQIQSQGTVVSGSENSFSSHGVEYDGLVAEQANDRQLLLSAEQGLQTAQLNAQHGQYYLEILSPPNQPPEPQYPRRLESMLIVFAVTLVLWSILR